MFQRKKAKRAFASANVTSVASLSLDSLDPGLVRMTSRVFQPTVTHKLKKMMTCRMNSSVAQW